MAAVYRRLPALDNYREPAHREMLRRELQTDPSPETVMLFERIRRGDEV